MSRKRTQKQKRLLAAASAAPATPAPVPQPVTATRRAPVAPRLESILTATWFLPTVLGLAALLRVANVLLLRGTPFVDDLQLDHRYYDEWARRIVHGDWAGGTGPFWVDPLYAYFLALLYAIFGRSLLLVRLVQAGLGVATCGLAARLGQRVSGSAAVGNLAALLIAIFIPAVYYDGTLEKTTLSLVLFTGALVLYFDGSLRSALWSGVLLGFAVLTRGNLLLFVVLGAIALAMERTSDARMRALAFIAGALAIVGVATVRNVLVGGELVPTTANFGQNLYVGQACTIGDGSYGCSFVRLDPEFEQGDFRDEAERRLGRKLGAAELSAYWRGQAVQAMFADPGAAVTRGWHNLRLFFHEYENSDNHNLGAQAESSPVLALPVLWMGQLFPLAVLGAVVSWRRDRARRLLAGMVAVYCASMLPLMVFARYRTTMLPCMAVLAATGVLWLAETVRRGDWAIAGRAAALVVPCALFSLVWPGWMATAYAKSMAVSYHDMGEFYLAAGKQDDAIQAYERAVAMAPDTVIASMRRLGDLYRQRKQYDRAERQMLGVLQRKPDSPLGRRALVQLYTDMAADPRYRDDDSVRAKLARARAAVN
ncbi:MAG TPA: glycosyltransferase family 39 protein [Candidatus Binatia bacterium]|nr:glycosyltransferase family 39 protein [Candidatus Binatia bacterium]